jgi:FkbH-like protein
MSDIYTNLSWLPKPPDDISLQLGKKTDLSGSDLRRLASYRLDSNQLTKLAKTLAMHQEKKADLSPLSSMTIGIVSNATTQMIAPCITGTALRYGLALDVIETEFNQVAQEVFSKESAFTGRKLDAVLVAIDYHGLPLTPTPGDAESANKTLTACMDYLKIVTRQLHQKTGAPIILQNIVPPLEHFFGSFEERLPGTTQWLIRKINHGLDDLASGEVSILDMAGLASAVGLEAWHDITLWNMAKVPFSQKFAPIYAEYICRILAAKRGKSRRCLILDLDNTMWGGIIGDDGMEGILIGNGDPTGEAHLAIQHMALALRNRGVVLAVCSKNEDNVARQPFREHPDMAVKEEHIAVFQANWSDKASNIKAIAQTLSLGLESMVLLDDNPAERIQVRRELPEVAVPELPEDPALFGRTLLAAGYFEAIGFSQEDQQRADFYQKNAQRAVLFEQSSDLEGYLKSLVMEIIFRPFDENGRSRIAQLVSKSNQFNLTTKRYSEIEIKSLEENPSVFTLQIRLTDTLGDNGMISVVICNKHRDYWEIDTWLMSCRVLGRCVEEAVLQEIILNAKKAGAKKLIGHYIPTARNMIVKDHYAKLGFTKTESHDDGSETWELDIAEVARPAIPMTVKR